MLDVTSNQLQNESASYVHLYLLLWLFQLFRILEQSRQFMFSQVQSQALTAYYVVITVLL